MRQPRVPSTTKYMPSPRPFPERSKLWRPWMLPLSVTMPTYS
jgi:hypothetical protein